MTSLPRLLALVLLVSGARPALAQGPIDLQIIGDGTWIRSGLTKLSKTATRAIWRRTAGVVDVSGIEFPAITHLVDFDSIDRHAFTLLPDTIRLPNLKSVGPQMAKALAETAGLDLGSIRLTDAAVLGLVKADDVSAGLPQTPGGLRMLLKSASALTLRLTRWPNASFLAELKEVGEGDVYLEGVVVTPARLKQIWGGRRTALGLRIESLLGLEAVLALPVTHLRLRLPAALAVTWAQRLGRWKGHSLRLEGVGTIDIEAARALAGFRGRALSLPDVRHLAPEVGQALGRWPGHELHLTGYRVDSPWGDAVRVVQTERDPKAARDCIPPKKCAGATKVHSFNPRCTLAPVNGSAEFGEGFFFMDVPRCLEYAGPNGRWRRRVGSPYPDETEMFIKTSIDGQFSVLMSTAMYKVERMSWDGMEVAVIHMASGATVSRHVLDAVDYRPWDPFTRTERYLAVNTSVKDGKLLVMPRPDGGVRMVHLGHHDLFVSPGGVLTLVGNDGPTLWRVRLHDLALLQHWEGPEHIGDVRYLLPGTDLIVAFAPCSGKRYGHDCLGLWSAGQNKRVGCARTAGRLTVEMSGARDALTWTSDTGKRLTIDPAQLDAWPGCVAKPVER